MGPGVFLIDAFADRPFGGNPAAVCFLEGPASSAWMQRVAEEFQLSETAFLEPAVDGEVPLRWFTPVTEVDLCGHATLASAHALWESGRYAQDEPIVFRSRSGPLTTRRRADGWIEMDFPATPAAACDPPDDLLAGLRTDPCYVGRSPFDFLVEVADPATVRDLRPDFARLTQLPVRGVIVTARGGDAEDVDFISRFFAPRAGVDEDPVTGSAHCCLAPYWHQRLGRPRLTGYQASPRGGLVRVEHCGSRVKLAGRATTVMTGALAAAPT